jgi:hypothetical protein
VNNVTYILSPVVHVPSRLSLETFKLKKMTSGGFLLFVEGEGTLDYDNHGGGVWTWPWESVIKNGGKQVPFL